MVPIKKIGFARSDFPRLTIDFPKALEQPGTIYDIAARTDLDHNAVARRMSELERLDLAYTNGKKKGASGRMCRVWVRKC